MPADDQAAIVEPGFRQTMLVSTVTLMSVMAAIDITIVTSALPYMQGSLNADADEITWVVTMFVIGQAISIGMTGHLAKLLGRQRLALAATCGFIVLSACCGLAQSLSQIVVFRFLQGFFGGPLIPISQAIIITNLRAADRVRALGVWAIGVMCGPAIGPALGGYFAENLNWRWNFWVNLPIGTVAAFLASRFTPKTTGQRAATDWMGIVLLTLMIVSLQITLDQGNLLDWFSSKPLVLLSIAAVTTGIAFVLRSLAMGSLAIIDLTLFKNWNFSAGCLLICLLGSLYLAVLILLPALMVDNFGWEVSTAGAVVGLAGLGGFVSGNLAPRMIKLLGLRWPIAFAFLLVGVGFGMLSRLNLDASPVQVAAGAAIAQMGVMLGYTPINAVGLGSLSAAAKDQGSGLFNCVKTLGFSFGTTAIATLLYRGGQKNWAILSGEAGMTNPGLGTFLRPVSLSPQSLEARALLAAAVDQQAGFLTVVQTCELLSIVGFLLIPLALLVRTPDGPGARSAAGPAAAE